MRRLGELARIMVIALGLIDTSTQVLGDERPSPVPIESESGITNLRLVVPTLFPQEFEQYQCIDSLPKIGARKGADVSFATATMLEIAIEDSTFVLNEELLGAVRHAAMKAIAFWNYTCRACRPTNLSVIRVDGELFINTSVYPYLSLGGEASPLVGKESLGESDLLKMVRRARLGEGYVGSGSNYIRADSEAADIKGFCAMQYSNVPVVAQPLFRVLCTQANLRTPNDVARLDIEMSSGTKGCGADSDSVIECEIHGTSVQFNTRDYHFAIPGPHVLFMGSGSREVDLQRVLIHEAGHWIGLPHSSKGMMRREYGEDQCLMDSDVRNLDQLVDAGKGASTKLEKPTTLVWRKETRRRPSP